MDVTRRDFLKGIAFLGGALALKPSEVVGRIKQGLSAYPPVIWLQGQGCSGCSVSFLNTIYYKTADELLLKAFELTYHPTLMSATGALAESTADAVAALGGYILVVEGAVPVAANGDYCIVWEGTNLLTALGELVPQAARIIALGTCASFGGISAGAPNPSGSLGVGKALERLGMSYPVINIPGCPAHPDWLVGTVVKLLGGTEPALNANGQPLEYFGRSVHSRCPNRSKARAKKLSDAGCLRNLGCKGTSTYADCPVRKWNSGAQNQYGVSWCVGARNPCQGCTQPDYPDGTSPFYTK
jgi:hydrogenase small subunit